MRLLDKDALLLEFGEEPLNWTNSDSEIQAQRDYRLFTKIVEGAPTIDIETEVAREIFAEIDKITYRYLNDTIYSMGEMIYDLNDLKNKYIGGVGDERTQLDGQGV